MIPQYQDPDQGWPNFQNVGHWSDGYGNRENRSHWSDPFNNGLFSGGPGHDANQTFFRNMMSDADFFLATTSNKGKRIVSPRYFAPTPTLESGSLMVYSSSSNQINCYDPVDLRNDSPQEILDKSSSNIAHYLRGRYDRGVMRAAGNSVETPETRISDFFNLNGYGYYDKIGFGELINETTPKGYTDYVYSPLGKLLEKNISGDNTPGTSIVYSYNPLKKYLEGIVVTSADGNNSTYAYGYDDDDRLESVSETNPYAQFTNQYTYDGFGRIETEEYYAKLLLNNKTSTKKIKNLYQNGQLKNIRDFSTNNNIWNATGVNARGQLISASIGNNMIHTNSYNTYGYLTNSSIKKETGSVPEVLMQLTTDFDVQRGILNSRSNSMFSWSETFGYDNLDRLVTFNDNEGDNTLNYDNLGRITFNNTVGDYNYSGTSYQVANIDLNNQGDLYYQQNRLEQIKYNAFKKPFEIYEEGKEKIGFQYNAFMGRSSMFYGDSEDDVLDRNNRKHYSSDGSMEISYDEDENETLFITYIGGDAYTAPAIWRSEIDGGRVHSNYYYLHRDYLGSILLITNGNGTVQEKRHFDAWGKIVKLTDGNDNNLDKLTFLDRGYTGHEHLQGVNLIHMNGRLYDPSLKRFLSADNFIQDINNTQNFNRYGYVLNNPLLYVDPSGESYSGPGGNCVECDYNNNGPKYDYQNSLDGAQSVDIDIDFRGLRNWISNNVKSGINGVGNFFEAIGDLFKKGDRPPVEYSNYDGLSSDPLAGPIADTPTSFFGGGGTADGGLGIKESFNKFALNSMMFKMGFENGFGAGASSTIDFIKGLGTAEGWQDLGQGVVNFSHMMTNTPYGAMQNAQMASSIGDYMSNIPSMSAYEVGYDMGYGTEKIVEGVVLTRGVGLGMNVWRGAKFMRGAGGNINGFTISKGAGFGAKPRFDYHKLSNSFNTRATSKMTIPKWLDGKKLPHYHRGRGNNLRYHRPWEIGPDGKRRW
ncbi:RHS repeat domain-containing protein [Bizionia sp.]|uniref:RHS repeat domain-containing protein n=1 Tax=Bizionia sp. TaxID=1954480 RepID=UPI003A943BE2